MKLNLTSMSTRSLLLVATLLLGFAQTTCPRLEAADLFQVRALGGGNDITVGGSSLPKLIEHAVTARDAFAVFENVSQYQVSLTYGGVPNALRLNIEDSASEFVARLTSGLTDLDREFRGATADDVYDDIEDFLTKDAPAELARLQRQLNRLSKVAVTDGNPHSSTARAAHETYRLFARALPATRAERDLPKDHGGRAGFSILPEVGVFRADGYEGVSVSLPLAMGFRLGDGVGLVVSAPLHYTEIEGAHVLHGGVGVGIPIEVLKATPERRLGWQLTPSGGAFGSGSYDMAAGGLAVQGAGSSLLSYHLDALTVSMGNHISFYEGVEIYGYDGGVSQQILKNGLQVTVPVGQRWLVDTHAIHTRFLQPAAVRDYATLGADLIFRILGDAERETYRRGYAVLGAYANLGSGYRSATIRGGMGWQF